VIFDDKLKAIIYGDAGAGKSWAAATAPGPRLVIDSEGGSHLAKRPIFEMQEGIPVVTGHYRPHLVRWDPILEPMPIGDVTADTTVLVRALNLDTVDAAYNALNAGGHPFRSVIVDSLSDMQFRHKGILTKAQVKTQDATDQRSWGILLTRFVELCCAFRDLTDHPVCPLDCVVILSGAAEDAKGVMRPMVQGALRNSLAGYMDLMGYMEEVTPDVIKPNETVHRLHFRNSAGQWKAKDRTDTLSKSFPMGYVDFPHLEQILYLMNTNN